MAYFGELDFSSGDWVGVVLDEPTGNHDGKIHGREYFHCAPLHGLFVRPTRVGRLHESPQAFEPSPSLYESMQTARYTTDRASGRTTQDSYYYDEDYRLPKSAPTIESLERKLRSLERRASSDNLVPTPQAKPNGILKRGQSSQTNARPASASGQQSPVFNFRPKRAQLDEYEHKSSLDPSRMSSAASTRVDMSSRVAKVGDRVLVKSERGQLLGTLRYLGETQFATGDWAGVELDDKLGKNDGSVLDHRYFSCPNNYGLFVPSTRIKFCPPGSEFKSMRSTIKSPPPPTALAGRTSSTPTYSHDSYQSSSPTYSASPSVSYSPGLMSASNQYPNSATSSPSPSLVRPKSYVVEHVRRLKPSYYDATLSKTSNPNDRWVRPKFKESDLDAQLRKYTQTSKVSRNFHDNQRSIFLEEKPKSVVYTFKSSKYDGNPIALRTVQY